MSVIDDAVAWAKKIAEDDTHGYDQTNRWGPDYDNSSFVISAWEDAGVGVKANGATTISNMCAAFEKTGFTDVAAQITMQTGAGLVAGDVLWKRNITCLYVGNGEIAIARSSNKDIVIENYYKSEWSKVLRYTI